jgi:hypothetical protein
MGTVNGLTENGKFEAYLPSEPTHSWNMKNSCLFILLISLSSAALAQTGKFRLGVEFSPRWSYRIFKTEGLENEVADVIRDGEIGYWGFGAHVFGQYRLSPKWSLQLGLGYSNIGYRSSKKGLIFATPEPNGPNSGQFAYNYYDITIPLSARFHLGKKPSAFYVTCGMAPVIKLKRATTLTLWYEGGSHSSRTTEDNFGAYRDVNLNGIAGFGYEMSLGKKMRIYFQPTFECNILGVTKSTNIDRKLYSIGLATGWLIIP